MDRKKIYVLFYRYYDGSGMNIVRTYESKERAEEDLRLVADDFSKEWELSEIEIYF